MKVLYNAVLKEIHTLQQRHYYLKLISLGFARNRTRTILECSSSPQVLLCTWSLNVQLPLPHITSLPLFFYWIPTYFSTVTSL